MSSRPSRGAARLAAILDALPDALLLVNCNGTVVNANAIALETFETPGTALVGRGLLDLLPTFDSNRIPGSMRRPEDEPGERTKPTRMIARRTDGFEFPVEVASANVEDGRAPYAHPDHYTGDELLMLVVRDLTGTLDTEAELARQQRQTEMILRAAAEGVVGVDTEGKVVLVNPSAAHILGYRASDLGGQELHRLIQHSKPDGTPLPVEDSPLSDTLKSGRKHRVRSTALWRKDGRKLPVDLTTAPVRDGDQLVGAVMTFTDRTQLDAVADRADQLQAVLETSLRGPLEEMRRQLSGLAADPAGQLWPEANQILHHLSAGYARITTLIDNVVAYSKLETGAETLERQDVGLDEIVAAGVEGAVDLIGPGRAQYAVHAPPVEVSLDGARMSQALAHLIADTIGVDVTGTAGTGDSTIVVAAAQRGDVARIEVRGPQNGGHPVHLPLARGIVEKHGGVLQIHEVPGQGSAYVVEVPLTPGGGSDGGGDGSAPKRDDETTAGQKGHRAARGGTHGANSRRTATAEGGRPELPQRPPRQRQAPAESALALPAGPSGQLTPVATPALPAAAQDQDDAQQMDQPTGRRRALHKAPRPMPALPPGGSSAAARPDPEQADAGDVPPQQGTPTGRRARRALPPAAEHVPDPETQFGPEPLTQGGPQPMSVPVPPPLPMPPMPRPPSQPQPPSPSEGQNGHQARFSGSTAFPQAGQDSTGGQNALVPTPSGRRRKLAAPGDRPEAAARLREAREGQGQSAGDGNQAGDSLADVSFGKLPVRHGEVRQIGPAAEGFADTGHERGRAFSIGAPAEGAEGPEHLDEVMSVAEPDEPDVHNPRRLLVWPEPDASTREALTNRGYDPVIVRSREEVTGQVASAEATNGRTPAALFVDPLTGPITRTALQSLRTAATAAEVPVLVTAGLGQATREAAYGADPAVLLKALAPRDNDQHPPRVLLVEGHQDIAAAFTATLERRGMQVVHATTDPDAVTLAEQVRPNLVVMDLMLIRRRRAGIVDWLRHSGLLNRTPLVVYTSVDIDPAELPRLRSGETVLFLAERSTSGEVQGRIVDLLGKIGTRASTRHGGWQASG